MIKNLIIQGYQVYFNKNLVKIIDNHATITQKKSFEIIKYLFEEGFLIDKTAEIKIEIYKINKK